jgi:hypothetical protein
MTEHDESGKDRSEFVAVTPRGGEPATDEAVAAEPEDVAVTEPAAPPVDDPAEPSQSAESEPPAAPTAPEPATASIVAERPDVPSLDKTGADAPRTDPGVRLPEPERDADGGVEVSVRVAAEGMAAALSSAAPVPGLERDAEPTRSAGPLAIVTAVCVVLALAAAVLLAVTARTNSHHRAVAAARTAALDAAKRETAVALTYDYRSLDADFQRAEAGMSRKFRANYARTAASSVAPLATKTHAITTGTIAAGGVVSATPDTARILVFANQTVENKLLNATSRLDRSVIEVTMVKENGRWVIDNLQPF